MNSGESGRSDGSFAISITPGHLRICFSSTLENIDRAIEETKKFIGSAGMERHEFGLILVVREGLLNAVVHGNSSRCEKTVRYRLSSESRFFEIEIEDEGEGFDWRSCGLLEIPGITCVCGRGMAIMKSYSRDVRFNEKGNVLTLIMSNDR